MIEFELNGNVHLIDSEMYDEFDAFILYALRNQSRAEERFYVLKHENRERYEELFQDFLKIEIKNRSL
jgi:hypothetical protein